MLHVPDRRAALLTADRPLPGDAATEAQLAAVRRWRAQMRGGVILAVGLFALWVVLTALADGPWLAPVGLLFALGIVAFGVVVLFGGRCPRCERRLTPRPGLRPPSACPWCRLRLE